MDNYGVDEAAGALPDEYAALADARQVMGEVLGLMEDLHGATTRLGDALVGAGLPAREWLTEDCRLLLLSDQFPDVTLDDVVTRLAEFAAGMGPHWLHGGLDDVARFNDEVSVLSGVVRSLRVVAQRLRMLPPRERGDFPLERALGDPRVGTPLDRVATIMRDLESLGPYIQPLTAEEWNSPAPTGEPDAAPDTWLAGSPPSAGQPTGWPPTSSAVGGAQPLAQMPQSAAQPFRRLRDFMPPPGSRAAHAAHSTTEGVGWETVSLRLSALARDAAHWLRPRKWLVAGILVMVLALGTALLALVSQPAPSSTASVSSLAVVPAKLTFACSGKGASLSVSLRNTGTRPLTWTAKAPSGLTLSATHGAIQPATAVTIHVHVTSEKPAKGTLAFTSSDGAVSVPYTVTCK